MSTIQLCVVELVAFMKIYLSTLNILCSLFYKIW